VKGIDWLNASLGQGLDKVGSYELGRSSLSYEQVAIDQRHDRGINGFMGLSLISASIQGQQPSMSKTNKNVSLELQRLEYQ